GSGSKLFGGENLLTGLKRAAADGQDLEAAALAYGGHFIGRGVGWRRVAGGEGGGTGEIGLSDEDFDIVTGDDDATGFGGQGQAHKLGAVEFEGADGGDVGEEDELVLLDFAVYAVAFV